MILIDLGGKPIVNHYLVTTKGAVMTIESTLVRDLRADVIVASATAKQQLESDAPAPNDEVRRAGAIVRRKKEPGD